MVILWSALKNRMPKILVANFGDPVSKSWLKPCRQGYIRVFRIGMSGVLLILSLPGLEIRGCREPRAPLNAPAAPSNVCREPKYVLFDIQNTFMKLMKMQLGSLEKNLNFEPWLLNLATNINHGLRDWQMEFHLEKCEQGSTFPGARGHMPLDFAVGP